MSEQNLSQSPSGSGSNGKHETQPEQEQKMKPPYTDGTGQRWVLEDFSQNRINRGQQRINYLITDVDRKIVDALKQLSDAVGKLADNKVDVGPVNNAIKEVSAATDKIAGEFPPGCTEPN